MSETTRVPDGPPEDDRELLSRLRKGDGGGYEELVRQNTGRLLAVTRRLLGNDEDARDAVQDAFISAFRALDRFQGNARLSTWLHRIAVNAALMKLRSRRNHPEESIEDLLPVFDQNGFHVTPTSPLGIPEEPRPDAKRLRTAERVRAAMDELPESYRTVLLLRDIEELDTKETAEMLGVTPNAVKIRLHRARQALKGLLERAPVGGES